MDNFCRCGPLATQLRVEYGSRQIKVQHILLEAKDGVRWRSVMGWEEARRRDQRSRLKLKGQGEAWGGARRQETSVRGRTLAGV